MDGVTVFVDIEDSAGNRLGGGPITSLTQWSCTARLDKAGTFSFTMPANDPKAAVVAHLRVASIYALIGGSWQYVGGGLVDVVDRSVAEDGTVLLTVSGDDMLRELSYPNLFRLQVGDAVTPVTHAQALQAVMYPYAPAGWTWTADPAPSHDQFYGQFNYESPLTALTMLADRADSHFRLTGKRAVAFASTWAASGLRAIRADDESGDLAAETCAITELQITAASQDMATTLIALGGGLGGSMLSLYQASAPPFPFSLVKYGREAWLFNGDLFSTLGVDIIRTLQFKDIAPLSNTAADTVAASNELKAAALAWLRKHSRVATAYSLTLAGCQQILRPLQTLRVAYRDVVMGLALDADLYVLEVTLEGSADGPLVTRLVVADSDWWPESDAVVVADSIQQGRVYQVHPQMNANSYVIPYSKSVDELEEARFRFRFDDEVWQIARATFDFQLLPLESTVKSIAAQSATTSAGGGTTATSSSGGGQTSSSDGSHSHTVTIGNHDHTVTIAGHTHTVTISDHAHDIDVEQQTATVTNPVGMDGPNLSDMHFVIGSGTPGNINVATTADGGGSSPTSSSGGSQTPTSSSGGGSTPTSSSGGSHTHTVSSHTHDVTISNHTHTVTPTVNMVYGIFRDSAGNLFALADLEYSLDNSTWYAFTVGVNGFAVLGDGWIRIDITALISDVGIGGTFAPLQANWLLRVRRKSTGATGKKANIEAQLTVRSIIRAYAFT